MLTILVVILILALLFGGWGHPRWGPYYGWSPAAAILAIILLLWLIGAL